MAKLRKECDELRAAEIRALKAKKEEMKVGPLFDGLIKVKTLLLYRQHAFFEG